MLKKNQNVVGPRRDYRYRVERVHRDGTATIRAIFSLDADGRDYGMYAGYKYRVEACGLTPLTETADDRWVVS